VFSHLGFKVLAVSVTSTLKPPLTYSIGGPETVNSPPPSQKSIKRWTKTYGGRNRAENEADPPRGALLRSPRRVIDSRLDNVQAGQRHDVGVHHKHRLRQPPRRPGAAQGRRRVLLEPAP